MTANNMNHKKGEKFWTVRDGVIGTAHINRNGEEVDFRPCSVSFRVTRKGDIGTQPDEEVIKEIIASVRLEMMPPAGVEMKFLARELVPTQIEHTVTVDDRGLVTVRFSQAVVVFEGTEIRTTKESWRWWGNTTSFWTLSVREAQRAAKEAEFRKQQEDFAAIGLMTPAEVISIVHPVWSHFRHERMWEKAAKRVQAEILAHAEKKFGQPWRNATWRDPVKFLPPWAQDLASIRQHILAERDAR